MTTMAVHVQMCRSGYWPERVSAAGWGFDNVLRTRADVLVRPTEGERTVETPQALAEREGMEGDDVRCVLRLVGGQTKGAWTGLVRVSRFLVLHDVDETDRRLRIAREAFGMSPEWRRPAMLPHDTARAAAAVMGRAGLPSLAEATEAILGRRMTDVDGVVALFNQPDINRVCMRDAA